MIQPYIDFDSDWDLDKCNSLFSESVRLSNDCDLIIGLSLGGYLADLVANELSKNCIIINPGIDRSKTRLHIKDFNCDRVINNCNLEVYLGDKDIQIPNSNTIDYLNENNINARVEIIKGMEHVFNIDELIQIIKMSKLI